MKKEESMWKCERLVITTREQNQSTTCKNHVTAITLENACYKDENRRIAGNKNKGETC